MKGVFDVTFQSALDVFNYGLVLIYGLFLSVSIAGGCTEKRDKKLVALLCPVFLVLQSLFALTLGTDKTMQLYPLIVHLPLVLILTLALKKPLGVAVVSTCTAYLCCQPLRWGKNAVEALTGSMLAADIAYIVLLVGVFWLCERFLVKAAYATMTYSRWTLLLFGSLPVTYYIFDYATTVYSNALYSNVLIISEFLPTVLVTFYILFLPAFHLQSQRQGAVLTVDASLPNDVAISDTELCSLLSNGLENALHAVADLPADRKQISLYCGVRQNKLLIEIRNPCAGPIAMRDGLPVSDREGHGYGCRSIQAIAQRNGGLCVFSAQQGQFLLQIMLPVLET